MNIILSCIGCGKIERKVLEDPVPFSAPLNVNLSVFLSRECSEKVCRSYVPGFNFNEGINFLHENCGDLYALSDD